MEVGFRNDNLQCGDGHSGGREPDGLLLCFGSIFPIYNGQKQGSVLLRGKDGSKNQQLYSLSEEQELYAGGTLLYVCRPADDEGELPAYNDINEEKII